MNSMNGSSVTREQELFGDNAFFNAFCHYPRASECREVDGM